MKKVYHKGQVIYNNKSNSPCFGLWGEITIVSPAGGSYIRWENNKEHYYSNACMDNNFLLKIEKEKEMKDNVTKWTFNVLSSAAICEQEIKNNLTRANPVAIVQISTGMVLVMVHQWLLEKAEVLEISTPEEGYDGIYFLQTTQLSEWVTWAKAVKTASWGDERVPAKVTVSLPQI